MPCVHDSVSVQGTPAVDLQREGDGEMEPREREDEAAVPTSSLHEGARKREELASRSANSSRSRAREREGI